jgi:hypothetical protein
VPSPKSHRHEEIVPVERSTKAAVSGAGPTLGTTVKSACAGRGSFTTTARWRWSASLPRGPRTHRVTS